MIFLRMFLGCLIQLLPFSFLCYYPFGSHTRFSKKKTWVITGALVLVLSVIFASTCCYLKMVVRLDGDELLNAANAAFMLSLIPSLVWYIFATKEIWQKKLFVFMFAMTSAFATTSVCNVIEIRLQKGKPWDGLPYAGTTLITLTISAIIAVPLLWLLLKYYYVPVSEGLTAKESGNLSLLSILLFMVIASCLYPTSYEYIYNPLSLFLYCALLITVFVVYFVYFKMFFYAHEKLMAQQNLTQVQHQFEINEEQYKRIAISIENSRKIRHDFRHHAIVLLNLLNQGKVDETEKYLKQYVGILGDYESLKLCDNIVVNTVLSYYKSLAEEKDIIFSFRIKIPDKLNISDSDVSVLLGNLLENALDAVVNALEPKRYIALNIVSQGKMVAVTVDNGFCGELKMNGDKYLSTKENHSGIGLQSVTNIAEKYSGGVEFTHEEFIFHSSVMINAG